MVSVNILPNREAWLEARKGTIGGSDAACVLGLNPWKSNTELFDEMTGRKQVKQADNNAVRYGTEAEVFLRELFKLDYPQLAVGYEPNNIWTNDRYPFAHASLDGWLSDEKGRGGILEIKTATMQNSDSWRQWDNEIPMHYYCQVIFYMAVCEAEFAVLKAKLMWKRGEEVNATIRHYQIERKDVEKDIEYLMLAVEMFDKAVKQDRRPGRLLPEL